MKLKMAIAGLVALLLLTTAMLGGAGAVPDPKPGPDWGVQGASVPNWGDRAAGAEVSSPLVVTDTVGDSIYRKGDITSIKVVHTASTVRLIMRTRVGSDPATSPAWVVGYSNIQWLIDVNGGDPDFLAGGWNDGTQVRGDVVLADGSSTHVCDAFFGGSSLYRKFVLSFSRACISNPSGIRVASRMQFDRYPTDPQTPLSEDLAPNSSQPTPFVTL